MVSIEDVDDPHPVQLVSDNLKILLIPWRPAFDHLPKDLDPVGWDRLVVQGILPETEVGHRQEGLDETGWDGDFSDRGRHGYGIEFSQIDPSSRHDRTELLPDPPREFPNLQRHWLLIALRQFFWVESLLGEIEDLPAPLGPLRFPVFP